jgi:hypothetical protein
MSASTSAYDLCIWIIRSSRGSRCARRWGAVRLRRDPYLMAASPKLTAHRSDPHVASPPLCLEPTELGHCLILAASYALAGRGEVSILGAFVDRASGTAACGRPSGRCRRV